MNVHYIWQQQAVQSNVVKPDVCV